MIRVKKNYKKVCSVALLTTLGVSSISYAAPSADPGLVNVTITPTSNGVTPFGMNNYSGDGVELQNANIPIKPPTLEKQNITTLTVRGTDVEDQNQILGPQGGSGGFPFPVFNNYDSQRQYIGDGKWVDLTDDTKYQGDFTMFDAAKDDLGIYFKVTGDSQQYPQFADFVRINDPEQGDHNLSLSYFWEWGGGIHLNFPKNNGTTDLVATVKLASLSNPNIKTEYKFTIKPAAKLTSIGRGSESAEKQINAFHNAGIHFESMAFNGGSSKYLQVADDMALYVKRKAPYKDYQGNIITEDEKEWTCIDNNPESGFVYGKDFGHYWNDGGGLFFNVAQTFDFKMQSKSDSNVSVEFNFKYDAPNPDDKFNQPLGFTPGEGPDLKAKESDGSIGFVIPQLGGRIIDLDEVDYFKKFIWAWDYEVVGSGETAKVVRRDPSVPEVGPDVDTVAQWNVKSNIGKEHGAWKEIGVDMDSGWRYALAGYKPRDGKQFSLWFDYVYGYWFQPVKYDTQMVFSRPEEDGGFNKTGVPTTNKDTLVYNFTGNPKITIPEALVLEDLNDEEWKPEVFWSDEFEGNALDTSMWNYETGYYLNDDIGTYGWGNNEKQWYKPGDENVFLEEGKLNIVAKQEPRYDFSEYGQPSVPNQVAPYSSGKIHTKDKFSFTYGRIDFKAKAPTGNGLWPALWMMPNDEEYGTWAASGEIDIFEGRGRVPGQSTGALHFGGTWPNNVQIGGEYNYADHKPVENVAAVNEDPDIKPTEDFDSWHIYSAVWEEDIIKWYVDGKFYNAVTQDEWWSAADQSSPTAPFDKDFYPIINLAMGGWFDNVPVDESKFVDGVTAPLQVDYVRVYKPVGDITEPPTKPDPQSIVIDKTEVELSGEIPSVKLNATIEPLNANQSVTWTTSNDKVATVSSNGTVNAAGQGMATITGTTVNGLTVQCKVTVSNFVPVVGIEFEEKTHELKYGETFNIAENVKFNPTNATNKNLEFKVEKDGIITIENGVVKPVSNGTTTVTAITTNGKTATCTVTVTGVPSPVVKLSQTLMELTNATPVGKLSAVVLNSADSSVTWSSNNDKVATVKDGVVTATGNGTVEVTAKSVASGDVLAKCTVKVTGYGQAASNALPENVIKQTADSVTIARPSNSTGGLFVTSDMSKTSYTQVGYAGDMPVVNGKAQVTITKKPVMDGAGFTNETLKIGDQFKYWTRVNTSEGEKVEGPFTYTHKLAEDVVATGITMKPEATVQMQKGDIYQLAADIAPINVTSTDVIWTSSDEGVVTVNGEKGGLLTAINDGTATITVKTKDGKHVATCEVTVGTVEVIEVESIKFANETYALPYGSEVNLLEQVTFNPTDATNKKLTFEVADESILVVENGVAKPLANGTTTVTAKSANGKVATCEVTVSNVPDCFVKISQTEMALTNATPEGKLAAVVMNDTVTDVTWKSSDDKVATVVNGVVTAKGNGTAVITASPVSGGAVIATCNVTVTGYGQTSSVAPQENVISQTADSVTIGLSSNSTGGLFITSDMSKTSFTQVGYGGDMPVVNGKAQITITKKPVTEGAGFTNEALKAGDQFKYWVRVNTSEGEKVQGPFTYTHQLSKEVAATAITMKPQASITMESGDIYQLAGDIAPLDVTNRDVVWTSSDETVVTVGGSKGGLLTAKGEGTATVTVKTKDNKFVASCEVTVGTVEQVEVESINFGKGTYELAYGSNLDLAKQITFNPTDATNKKLTFKVADSSILVVENGIARPLANGTTTVTATSANGKTATCEVTVINVPDCFVKINQTEMALTNATPEGKLTAVVMNDTVKDVKWESSDAKVVTVVDGVVTAKGNGTAVVTASPVSGSAAPAKCTVTVTGYGETTTVVPQENVISQTADSVTIGLDSISTGGLFVTSDMGKTSFTQVGYGGDMPVVNGKAQVTITKKPVMEGAGFTNEALKAGDQFKYWVRVNTSEGEKMVGPFVYTHQLTEEVPGTGITIKPGNGSVTLGVGDTYQLSAEIAPGNVSNTDVVWTSSNTNVVTVGGSKGGLLTAKGNGTATITVKTKDGKLTATYNVTVK